MTTQRNLWTALAGALLLLLALPFGVIGASLIAEALIKGHAPGGSGGVFEILVGFGAALVVIGSAHILAAAQAWRQRSLVRSLPRGIGVAGLMVGSMGLAISLVTASDIAAMVLLFPVAYLAVLVALHAGRVRSSS